MQSQPQIDAPTSTQNITRVGCLVDSISRDAGGLQTSVRRLMQLLKGASTDLAVFSVMDRHTEEDAHAWQPVDINVERRVGPKIFGFSPLLGRALSDYHPDVVNTHGLWTYTSIVSYKWMRETGRPVIIHPHGMLDPWALKNSGWKKKLALLAFERRHLKSAACIRALCQSELESIRKLGLKTPVCVIPNGIDVPDTLDSDGHQPAIQSRNGRPHKLLYLGRIHPKKGIPELIKAWAALQNHSEMKDWQLQIAGWDQGGHEQELKSLASALELPWRDAASSDSRHAGDPPLQFVGPRFGKDKDDIYTRCDAFILPSLSEGLPMVVLEAWAYSKPALITPMCNLPEGPQAEAALEIQPETESIADSILKLVQMSEDQRHAMGMKGKQLVQSRFTWPTIAGQLAQVNEWLLHGGERPSHVHL